MNPSPELSGKVIAAFFRELRLPDENESTALTKAISVLCKSIEAIGGSVWRFRGDQLIVTAEHFEQHDTKSLKRSLDTTLSLRLAMNFITEFSELAEGDLSPIYPQGCESESLQAISHATECGSSQFVLPMRAKGIFLGVLTLRFRHLPIWTADERLPVQETCDLLSMVLYQCKQLSQMKIDAEDLKLIAFIHKSLANNGSNLEVAANVAEAIAKRLHFNHSVLFLPQSDGKSLMSNEHAQLPLAAVDHPVVETFLSQRRKNSNSVYGYLLPLVFGDAVAGVLSLNDSNIEDPFADPCQREIALTLTGELAEALSLS
jgi:hypothetical protein